VSSTPISNLLSAFCTPNLPEPVGPDKMTNANAHSVAPPYQLIRGDTYNLTLGVVIAVILAACKVRAPAA